MGHRVRYVGRELVQCSRAIAAAPDLLRLEPKPGHDWGTEFIRAAARVDVLRFAEGDQIDDRRRAPR